MNDGNNNKCIHEYECLTKDDIEIMQKGALAWRTDKQCIKAHRHY